MRTADQAVDLQGQLQESDRRYLILISVRFCLLCIPLYTLKNTL